MFLSRCINRLQGRRIRRVYDVSLSDRAARTTHRFLVLTFTREMKVFTRDTTPMRWVSSIFVRQARLAREQNRSHETKHRSKSDVLLNLLIS